jgi:hypothetical protein
MDVTQVNSLLREAVGSLVEKKISDREAERYYTKYFENVSVNIMALGTISDEIKRILSDGSNVDRKMKTLVKKYREN